MAEMYDFQRPVFFPALSRKLDNGRYKESIGLADWSTRIHSTKEDKVDKYWKDYVEIIFVKGNEDIRYEIIESERDVIVRYYWKDFDKKSLEDDEDE